ncbi:Uncharacterised protein [Stenotrophomonas maltophilia]|nr:Uncharacterised protein [Stenotrophomonas maltophilia]
MHRQLPLALCILAGVKRNGDAFGAELLQPAHHLIGTAHGQRADHYATGAGIEDARHVVATAHATAGLHLQRRLRTDRREQRRKGVATGTRSVQVDQMHPLRALRSKGLRARQGVVAIRGFLRVVALAQPHHAAITDIQRGVNDETHAAVPSRKLRSISEPVSPERSGWNCAP